MGLDRKRIYVLVKREMETRVPGYWESLEGWCLKLYRRGCIDLFLDEPEKLRNVLSVRYGGDTLSVYFVIRYLFLRPILVELNKTDVEEELATIFINNVEMFKKRLSEILKLNA